jgi:hypothetical protein
MATRSFEDVVDRTRIPVTAGRGSLSARPSATAQPKRLAEVCNPWAGRQSPCSHDEEADLVRELSIVVGADGLAVEGIEFERRDVTVLMTALRCGLTLPEIRVQAPGVRPARVLAAYLELERRRTEAEAAWRAIEADGTRRGFDVHGALAAQLLPAIVTQLSMYVGDAERFGQELAKTSDQIARTSRRVLLLEDRVAQGADEPDRIRELGTLLYDVYGHGAWSLETFLPPRVGTLVPLRLAALLGEDITAARRVS